MAEIIKINDSDWRIEDGHVRFFLLCGTKRAALIDSGMNTPDAKQIAEKLTELPIVLINTHADPDHISGNSSFDEFYMSPSEEENYRGHNGKGKLLPIHEEDMIDLGDRTFRIIDIPGHTPGSIAILDVNNRVLISGDTVQNGDIFMFGAHRNLEQYIESLKHLMHYETLYDVIYPMHGSFPVKPELTEKLLKAAEEIKAGTAQSIPVEVFGRKVSLYKFPFAGFLCDEKQRGDF